jgi:hypothetical protein
MTTTSKKGTELSRASNVVTEQLRDEETIEIGQWYWVKFEEEEHPTFSCVTDIGTNYVKFSVVRDNGDKSSWRIHNGEVHDFIQERIDDPQPVIDAHIEKHGKEVRKLLSKINELTARLGITPRGELSETAGVGAALVVASKTNNIEKYKTALVKAKEKTLPDLFKQVEMEHACMAAWMKVPLIPMKAEAKELQGCIETIEGKVFIVELYAGLIEDVEQIREGEPADNDEKIRLMQRKHFMDEECLLDYKAGGMQFENIRQFDRWLMKKKNRSRIFPFPRCVVAFQVRRHSKNYGSGLESFVRFWQYGRDPDKDTFLYIRNGDQYFRLDTDVRFGEELFPDMERSYLMGGAIYTAEDFGRKVITEWEYNALKEKVRQDKAEHAKEMREWKKLSEEEKRRRSGPYYSGHDEHVLERYELVNQDNVYYDDAMEELAKEMLKHNRIAVLLQGLLDRSKVFHPHPPWRLWTPEGFQSGVELVYDKSRTLTPGEAPDFEAYREELNSQLKKGSFAVGQYRRWVSKRSDYDRRNDWSNNGPHVVSEVRKMSRNGHCHFSWLRDRRTPRWVDAEDRPGWIRRSWDGKVRCWFSCHKKYLFNVSAYQPGDHLRFYRDPRTREDYLQWAPFLLTAEAYHAGKIVADEEKD